MAESTEQDHRLLNNEVVHQLPYTGEVRRDLPYGGNSCSMDIYYPNDFVCSDEQAKQQANPLVILVTGYPDPGFEVMTGMKMKQLNSYRSWASLLAASGMAAVTYSTLEPARDVLELVDHLQLHAASLQLDVQRIALWSCSGNVPNALNVLHHVKSIKAAVLSYGFMLDFPPSRVVADAASAFHFVNPNQDIECFPENVPLLVIKAGRDEFPGLNQAIDDFVEEGVARNSPISLVEYAEGVHGFDILDESKESVDTIKQMLDFLRLKLGIG